MNERSFYLRPMHCSCRLPGARSILERMPMNADSASPQRPVRTVSPVCATGFNSPKSPLKSIKGAIMKETRCVVKFFVLLLFAAALASPVWLSATAVGDDKDAASNKATASNSAEAATPAANPHAGHMMDMGTPQTTTSVGKQRKGISM